MPGKQSPMCVLVTWCPPGGWAEDTVLCAEADRGGRACSRPVCVAGRGHLCQRDLSGVARAGGGRLCGWWEAYISGGTGLFTSW